MSAPVVDDRPPPRRRRDRRRRRRGHPGGGRRRTRALAGVGDERLSDTVRQIAPPRFWWLLVNLGTALLASAVISLFDGTIQNMVALAVLMPIVASMGGNAGTQTMTVAVRALATQELSRRPTSCASSSARRGGARSTAFAFALIIG